MSVKIDPAGRRWVQAEVEVPGTPEQVWEAIATGPGVSSWFVPTERRDDGTVVAHFGPGMDAVAKETAWDPPRRFAAEGEMGPGAPKLATEWIVEAHSGSTCIVRVVHSLFTEKDDWDGQLENIEGGWPGYFRILRLYLQHFAGLPCSTFQLMAMVPEPAPSAWETLVGPLGLTAPELGAHRKSLPGAPLLSGTVEAKGDAGHPHSILVRLDEPTTGLTHMFAMSMGGMVIVMLRFYLYGDQASAAVVEQEPQWQAWLAERFAPATPEG